MLKRIRLNGIFPSESFETNLVAERSELEKLKKSQRPKVEMKGDAQDARLEVFARDELAQLHKRFKDGITSAELVTLLKEKNMRFSEATLRKYVQLGLLPRSRRVGRVGMRRGSVGIYPVSIIAQIATIKSGLSSNLTLDAMRARSSLIADLETMTSTFQRVRNLLKTAADGQEKREFEEQLKWLDRQFLELHQRLEKHINQFTSQGD